MQSLPLCHSTSPIHTLGVTAIIIQVALQVWGKFICTFKFEILTLNSTAPALTHGYIAMTTREPKTDTCMQIGIEYLAPIFFGIGRREKMLDP